MLLPPFTPNRLQQMASPPRAWFFLLKERFSSPIVCKRLSDCWRFFPNNFSYLILRWQNASKETATSIICSSNYKGALLYEAIITQSKKFQFFQQCDEVCWFAFNRDHKTKPNLSLLYCKLYPRCPTPFTFCNNTFYFNCNASSAAVASTWPLCYDAHESLLLQHQPVESSSSRD